MEKKAPQELFPSHCHELLFTAMRMILPTKSNLAIREGNNPVVGNGNTMGVAGQIMKDVLRTSERRLRIHDSILAD